VVGPDQASGDGAGSAAGDAGNGVHGGWWVVGGGWWGALRPGAFNCNP
jgi:hypothetical protein